MAYNIERADGTIQTIEDGAIDEGKFSIGVVGRNATNYGETIAETQVNILENFASANKPALPVPGQLWYNKDTSELWVNDGQPDPEIPGDTGDGKDEWRSIVTVGSEGGGEMGAPEAPLGNVYSDSFVGGSFTGDSAGTSSSPLGNVYSDSFVGGTFDGVDGIFTGDVSASTFTGGTFTGTFVGSFEGNLTGTASSALYADVAERFAADNVYAYGTVVKLGGTHEITQTTSAFCDNVFGVVSEKPGLMLNSGAGNDETHPYIAFAGRVQVNVIGAVKKGQRIVSSDTPGVAIAPTKEERSTTMTPFNVIGRALETSTDRGITKVWVAVGAK